MHRRPGGVALAALLSCCAAAEEHPPPTWGRLESDRGALERAFADPESRFVLPGAERAYRVTIPPGAELQVGYAVLPDDWQRGFDRVSFSVVFRGADGGETRLLNRTRRRRSGSRGWRDRQLDLSALAGRSGTLRLRAVGRRRGQPDGDAGAGIWTVPAIAPQRPGPTAAPPAPRPGDGAAARPNVLLISIDTLRADHLSSYGYARRTSPRIDALAAAGVRFDQAIASSTWTVPSHASMLTGLHPSRHGAVWPRPSLSRGVPTLAEVLWDHGYATLGVVDGGWMKWRNGFDEGFDRYRGWRAQFDMQTQLKRSNEVVQGWLADAAREPFFLFVHTYEVHTPYSPPPYWAHAFDPGYRGPFRGRFGTPQTRLPVSAAPRVVEHARALYDAEIRHMDEHVGRLLDLLEESDLARSTCVILTSDHGEEFREHGAYEHQRGRVFEELVRIPLVVSCPGHFPGARVVPEPVSLVDVVPTVLELAGVPPEARPPLDGQSLVPALSGQPLDPERAVLVEVNDGPVYMPLDRIRYVAGLRDGRFKLVYDGADGSRVLYDLRLDPDETRDASAEHPEVVARLSAALERALAVRRDAHASRVEDDAPHFTEDPDLMEQLQVLGYVE